MLEGIAFLAVVTAGITSIFVARAQREIRGAKEPEPDGDVMVALADVTARLERIEQALQRPQDDHPVRTMPGPAEGA